MGTGGNGNTGDGENGNGNAVLEWEWEWFDGSGKGIQESHSRMVWFIPSTDERGVCRLNCEIP